MDTIDLDVLDEVIGGQATASAPAPAAPPVSDAELQRNNTLTDKANAGFEKQRIAMCAAFFSRAADLSESDTNVAKLQAQTGINCLGGLPQN